MISKKYLILFSVAASIVIAGFILKTMNTSSEGAKNTPKVKAFTPTPPLAKESLKIVAFGDSLTAGYGVTLEESYPSFLEKNLREKGFDIEVINMGVSGETSFGAFDRYEFIAKQNPEIILLGMGANDMLRGMSVEDLTLNLEKIITFFQENNITVVLLGMKSVSSNGKEYAEKFNAVYPNLAKKYNLPLVPFFLEGVALNPSLNTSDGIHPNKKGYEKVVEENILPILLPVLQSKK